MPLCAPVCVSVSKSGAKMFIERNLCIKVFRVNISARIFSIIFVGKWFCVWKVSVRNINLRVQTHLCKNSSVLKKSPRKNCSALFLFFNSRVPLQSSELTPWRPTHIHRKKLFTHSTTHSLLDPCACTTSLIIRHLPSFIFTFSLPPSFFDLLCPVFRQLSSLTTAVTHTHTNRLCGNEVPVQPRPGRRKPSWVWIPPGPEQSRALVAVEAGGLLIGWRSHCWHLHGKQITVKVRFCHLRQFPRSLPDANNCAKLSPSLEPIRHRECIAYVWHSIQHAA